MKGLLIVVFTFISISLFSQELPFNNTIKDTLSNFSYKNITGTITDSSGTPLFGVNILVKNTTRGTQTNEDGHYTITAKKEDILVFSFIGMHSQEVTIQNKIVIDIVLKENTESLKEVIVNAEKISRKEKARSYSSSVITSDKLIKGGYTNLTQALQGTVAGLYIHDDIEKGGVYLRGGTQASPGSANIPPLFIYDGMPLEFHELSSINFYDIGEIEVIKSASQALRYGPRAIGGVIVLTSKSSLSSIENKNRYKNENLIKNNYQGSLNVQESILDAPYIPELSKANSVEEAYDLYLKQKDQYGHLPTYYLDVYNHFKKWDNRNYELRILFNDVITNHHNPEQLKALAYLLEASKDYQLAINIYMQVLKLLPDDLQSYRDLALVYKNIGLVNESRDILKSLTVDTSNPNESILQFQNINDILKNDMTHLGNDRVDATYDVRIVADWNRYETNINLHVIDPTKEMCYYENPVTRQGGRLAQNMSQGGPEEFTLKNAKKGSYFVMVNYSLKDDLELTTMPTYIKLTLFKDYGKPNETKEIKIIRLTKPRGDEIVAKMEI
jgi:tetratricopeptide (TPR) repeat protein